MKLDMLTMSTVNITVTSVLAALLLFTWSRERSSLVGWWGLALLVMAAGALIAAASAFSNHLELAVFGPALVILGTAMQWNAAREFEQRRPLPLWMLVGPVFFLLAAFSGAFVFDMRLMLICALLAVYNFAAATELALGKADPHSSRSAVTLLLVLIGAGYICWLPLIVAMPIREASLALASQWFAVVILITLAGRVALAFMVLAMAKDRREFEQRLDALTDPLTGLPNRRALVEAADQLAHAGDPPQENPISVLLFDLDHFKEINDAYGHRLGDHVLKVFAATLSQQLNDHCIVARMGGEEFAAILPGANQATAARAAESVRSAFESSAAFVDGVAVKGTVSVGACSDAETGGDLGMLFHRADTALYRAKSAGRNRVVVVDARAGAEELNGAANAAPSAERRITRYGQERRRSA